MTTEQQTKLEQTYEFHAKEGTVIREADSLSTFLIGAQTILDNPQEWGLQAIEDSDERWCEVVDSFKQERDHYRRALEGLERITAGNPDYEFINYKAKEALKNNEG